MINNVGCFISIIGQLVPEKYSENSIYFDWDLKERMTSCIALYNHSFNTINDILCKRNLFCYFLCLSYYCYVHVWFMLIVSISTCRLLWVLLRVFSILAYWCIFYPGRLVYFLSWQTGVFSILADWCIFYLGRLVYFLSWQTGVFSILTDCNIS